MRLWENFPIPFLNTRREKKTREAWINFSQEGPREEITRRFVCAKSWPGIRLRFFAPSSLCFNQSGSNWIASSAHVSRNQKQPGRLDFALFPAPIHSGNKYSALVRSLALLIYRWLTWKNTWARTHTAMLSVVLCHRSPSFNFLFWPPPRPSLSLPGRNLPFGSAPISSYGYFEKVMWGVITRNGKSFFLLSSAATMPEFFSPGKHCLLKSENLINCVI